MRFLFLATKYSIAPDDPYMTDDLAGGLMARGHSVDVLLLDWDAPPGGTTCEATGRHGERVIIVSPRAVRGMERLLFRASKFLLSSHAAARAMKRHVRPGEHDALVAWTPALTVAAPLRRAIRTGIARRILIIFDFFPMSHREAGMIQSPFVYRVAKWLEDRLYRTFTAFIANLPGNADYLRRHYPVSPGADVSWSPIWADISVPVVKSRAATRARFGLPPDRPIALFGGQLCEGRGIEQMLEAARLSEAAGAPSLYLFVGEGRLRPLIEQAAAQCRAVRLLPAVKRADYLSIAAACDVGLVATVQEFTSWAFPTKTIDYLRVGIPVVTAVEPGSDYPELLRPYGVSENVASGDAAAMRAAVERLAATDVDLRSATRRCLVEIFDLDRAVTAVLAAAAGEG